MYGYIKTDKALYQMLSEEHPRYRLENEESNWWEVFISDDGENGEAVEEVYYNLDEDNLYEAIAATLDNLDEIVKLGTHGTAK
jgi:hypothetical protein